MTINEAVKLSIKENKCITRSGNSFQEYILPTDTTDCCIGFLKDENGNFKEIAVRWNPCAEDLIADDWELAE